MKVRNWAKAAILALALFLGACAHRVHVKPAPEKDFEGWSYREVQPDLFLVWIRDPAKEPAVREELCTKSYVCFQDTGGKVIYVQRKRK